MTKPLPEPIRSAAFALYCLSVLLLVFAAADGLFLLTDGANGFREYLMIPLAYLSAGTVLSAILLSRGSRHGRTALWFVLPLIVLSVPIGTALGLYVAYKLERPDAKAFFEATRTIPPG